MSDEERGQSPPPDPSRARACAVALDSAPTWDYRVNIGAECLGRGRLDIDLATIDGAERVQPKDGERLRCFACGMVHAETLRVPWTEVADRFPFQTGSSIDGGRLAALCPNCGTLYVGAMGRLVICRCGSETGDTFGISRLVDMRKERKWP